METSQQVNLKATVRPKKHERIRFPLLLWVVFISTLIACISGSSFLGFNVTGFAWAVPFFFAIITFLKRRSRIRFPLLLWIPWILIVLLYLVFAEAEHSFQRSIMILCPIFIGMTVSTLHFTEQDLLGFRRIYRYMAVVLYIVVGFKSGLLITGMLPASTGLAPQVMTGGLLCSLFATNYMFGQKRDLVWWGALAAIPVIGVTRMGMLATGLSLPLTFAPMKIFKRVVLCALIIAAGYGLFQTERVQQKTFYSGSGTLQDVSADNPNFATSGRKFMWDHMKVEIDLMPWFGHGANASETFVKKITTTLTHPHNDWLRLLYDYGYFGTVIFGICMLLQVLHLLKMGKRSSGERRILFFAAATTFISFSLFMFTDNIILYAAFFGNLQFTIMGMAYASCAASSADASLQTKRVFRRISW